MANTSTIHVAQSSRRAGNAWLPYSLENVNNDTIMHGLYLKRQTVIDPQDRWCVYYRPTPDSDDLPETEEWKRRIRHALSTIQDGSTFQYTVSIMELRQMVPKDWQNKSFQTMLGEMAAIEPRAVGAVEMAGMQGESALVGLYKPMAPLQLAIVRGIFSLGIFRLDAEVIQAR